MEQEYGIGFQLRLLNNAVKRRLMNLAPLPPGETATHLQGMIVHFLAERKEQELFQKDVETQFCIRRSTASTLLKRMEKNGLIHRKAVPQDARLKRLCLTEQAKQLHRQMEEDIRQVDAEIIEGIPREELDVFLRVIKKMQQNMEKGTQHISAGGVEDL